MICNAMTRTVLKLPSDASVAEHLEARPRHQRHALLGVLCVSRCAVVAMVGETAELVEQVHETRAHQTALVRPAHEHSVNMYYK